MNSAQTPKKKISEYKIEDLKEIFSDLFKKIRSNSPFEIPSGVVPALKGLIF